MDGHHRSTIHRTTSMPAVLKPAGARQPDPIDPMIVYIRTGLWGNPICRLVRRGRLALRTSARHACGDGRGPLVAVVGEGEEVHRR
jgi:hypothetical protein